MYIGYWTLNKYYYYYYYIIDNVNNLKDLGIIMSSNCFLSVNGVLAFAAGFSEHLAQESQPL